jgi:uracil-DNA glycosylase family 4
MINLKETEKLCKMCTRCSLRESASAPVFGTGNINAEYFILGEAPGRDEDRCGTPFVGFAGQKLNQLLELSGISENKCYLTNVCKCWPPKVNGKQTAPLKTHRVTCFQWLSQELLAVHPTKIIPLGATPLSLFTETGVTQLHGTQFSYHLKIGAVEWDTTIIPMYHPAAAGYTPRLWAVMLEDWEHKPDKVDTNFRIMPYQYTSKPYLIDTLMALDTENDEHGDVGQWSVAYRDNGELVVQPFKTKRAVSYTNDAQVVMHNAKYDLRVMKNNGMGVPQPNQVLDTMIAAYCLGMGRQEPKDSERSGDQMVGGLGLKYLGRRHLGMEMHTWQESKNDPATFELYNASDSIATYCLWEKWKPNMPKFFFDIDMPLLDTLMCMEDRGIQVDPNFLQVYSKELDARLKTMELPLNPFSHPQVAKYVYEDLKIEPTKFTKDKKPSVDKEVLETIDDPVVKKILEYRELFKEKSTYVESYINKMGLDNRIHCDFKQTSTGTSRLSAVRPNLQNVVKSDKLRGLFVAGEGMLFVDIDWWQLEICVFAAIAQEHRMLEALANHVKVHKVTAKDIGLPYDDAKTINFLMLYGGTPWKISQEFHVPITEATELVNKYYRTYPGIKRYHEQQEEIAKTDKKVSLWTGRTRRLDGMFSSNKMVLSESKREAVNTPIQGGGAEVVKLAMNDLHYKCHAPMLLQVHDELLFEVPAKEAKDYAEFLFKYVPTITTLNGLTMPIDVGIGKTWHEAKENVIFKPEEQC